MAHEGEHLRLDHAPAEVLALRPKQPVKVINVVPMVLVPTGKPTNWCGGTDLPDDEPPAA